MLQVLDQGFFVAHTLLIVFNMVGWAWRRTRLLHLVTMGATSFSWFVLGWFYGLGYCVCTDWHFQVRRQLGYGDLELSYIQLLFKHFAGLSVSLEVANWIAGSVFAFIVVATATVWALEWRRWRRRVAAPPSAPPAPAPE